jgi:hypothetical protein
MKLQCPCGAKYSFDITPEMAREPVRFVCPSCGYDSSDFVNEMIRKKLAEQAAASPTVPSEIPSAPEPAPAPAPARLRVATSHSHEPASPAEAPAPSSARAVECQRHPGEIAHERCVVCGKPLCPKCMELFGYVCSPLCKARATSNGIEIPYYENQKAATEAKMWRKVKIVSAAAALILVALLGTWVWYEWFGSRPKPVFFVRFDEKALSGMSKLCGKDQIVFLHGGTLARYDIKTKQQIWSRELIDKKNIEAEADREIKEFTEMANKISQTNPDYEGKPPHRDELIRDLLEAAQAALDLRVSGQNVWVMSPEKLTQFDWNTGKTLKEISRAFGYGRMSARGDELIFTGENDSGQPVLTHVNLASGELKTENIGEPVSADIAAAAPASGVSGGKAGALDPNKVAARAQGLSLPAKIALPATLANAAHNQAINQALNGDQQPDAKPELRPIESDDGFQLVPSDNGNVEFSVKLLEKKITSRVAMKAPPKKSVLDGNLTASDTGAAANEILNEMQRNRGGDKVTEDESKYRVTVHLPDSKSSADWTGEVIGPPEVFPLKTVNVVAGNKTLIVLDKANKKLWQADLSYDISHTMSEFGLKSLYGDGPCIERGDTLYVFDQAVLTAFDLANGNARWRVPTVGVVGIFFDDKGMLYVNTTTGSPDKIRYSRQIDVTDKTQPVIMKLDPKTGKTLWSSNEHGFVTYVSGKFIYAVSSFDPRDDDEPGNDNDLTAILRRPPFLRIRRVNPSNGSLMWEYSQDRAPLDIQFDGNSIELVFRKEVQVLRFFSL